MISINSNSFFSNPLSNLKMNINQNSNIKNIQNTKGNSNDEVLGYKVDKDGYFTEEFNEAARIPKDYKIHSSTIENINKSFVEGTLYYSNIDYAKTIANAYKIVSQLVDKSPELKGQTSFSQDDLAKHFPQNYIIDKNTWEVKQVYSYDEVKNIVENGGFQGISSNEMIAPSFFNYDDTGENSKPLPFNPDILHNSTDGIFFWDTAADKYTNDDGSITMGGLLIGFLSKNGMAPVTPQSPLIEGETTVFGKLNGIDKNVNSEDFSKELQMMSLAYTGSIAIPDLGIWGAKDLDEARKMFIEWRKNHPEGDNNDIIKIMEKQVKDSSNFLKNLGKNIKIKKKLDIEV